jgi:type IV pilus assembly protein PilA
MKKTQKKLGNKGFSLVELIVVIAIMAVLVGVLAPTLIKNVEKSRKSKDDQNLDTVRGSITTVLADETYHNALVSNYVKIDKDGNITLKNANDKALTELKDTIGKNTVKLTSNDWKDKDVYIAIDANGKVSDATTTEPTTTNTP